MIYNPGAAAGAGATAIAGAVVGQVPPLDPQSVNLCLSSAAFNAAPWNASGGLVVVADGLSAPNGVVEADSLQDPGAGLAQVDQNIVIPNDALIRVASCYFTFQTSTQVRLGLLLTGGGAPVDQFVDFNPANGTIIGGAGASFFTAISIEGVTWYRFEIQATNNASGNVTARPYIRPASLSAATVGNVWAWGAQVEQRARATQQIPTVGSQITRVAGKLPWWVVDGALPPGTIVDFGGAALPTGYLPADGANRSRTGTTAGIFANIGTTWGVGDGVTTFTMPDQRRRVRMGSGGVGTGTIGNAVGNIGGEENHTQSVAEMPSHSLPITVSLFIGDGSGTAGGPNEIQNTTATTLGDVQGSQISKYVSGSSSPVGSGSAFNVIQSAMICTAGVKV